MRTPRVMAIPDTAPPGLAAHRKRPRPFFLRAAAFCVALVLAWITAGFWLFVMPAADSPQSSDVLFVLGPPDDRIGYAEELMEQGDAGTLAVSSPMDQAGRFTAPICQAARSYRIICFYPEPFTTQGEARALQSMSQQYDWSKASVLTAQHHITRARVIIDRCYMGDLRMIRYDTPLSLMTWAYLYVYQTAAFIKAALHPEC